VAAQAARDTPRRSFGLFRAERHNAVSTCGFESWNVTRGGRGKAQHRGREDGGEGINVLQQQARFDDFLTRDNTDRPQQALTVGNSEGSFSEEAPS
jgi:hypothetical protein